MGGAGGGEGEREKKRGRVEGGRGQMSEAKTQ